VISILKMTLLHDIDDIDDIMTNNNMNSGHFSGGDDSREPSAERHHQDHRAQHQRRLACLESKVQGPENSICSSV
jgi:hypothetical protein